VGYFRVVAVLEALSYLSLLAASVAHRVANMQNLVPRMGLLHGLIFLVYLGFVLLLRKPMRWGIQTTLLIIIAAVIPLGGIYVERNYSNLRQ